MTEPTPNDPRKITLEDLLRLKRHERPEAEFWAHFDRELNEKVWRTLVQPPVHRRTPVTRWLLRGMGWMTAGGVAVLAVMLARTSQHSIAPEATPRPATQVTSERVATTAPIISTPDERTRVASATVATPVDLAASPQPTYAVADLTSTTSPAGYNKIPATLSFAAEPKSGERYATDAINGALLSARWRGSAY